jgi:hypothetical protein
VALGKTCHLFESLKFKGGEGTGMTRAQLPRIRGHRSEGVVAGSEWGLPAHDYSGWLLMILVSLFSQRSMA